MTLNQSSKETDGLGPWVGTFGLAVIYCVKQLGAKPVGV